MSAPAPDRGLRVAQQGQPSAHVAPRGTRLKDTDKGIIASSARTQALVAVDIVLRSH